MRIILLELSPNMSQMVAIGARGVYQNEIFSD